ncbi:MAG: Glycosyltransferase AglI [Candidatus Methanofastidiosum methylothiophilum]|uniref:Glycosyltransferase AglI n=1 Tax=Candidatus Methanofastidiosum methylothiophilum TaxID=1705564 RepID=A0A150J8A8_9EURY|nr:MAG: Glycosyltransferase AglI [Candidatus Methanofastidiosum methylthiophilus]
MEIITLFLFSLLFILFWIYLGYPIFLLVISKFFKDNNCPDSNYNPFVTIIIPTYNEEKVIRNKLINCLGLDYINNNIEIIVVDSASQDNTRKIVNEISNNNRAQIKLIEQNTRKGKASAVNLGLKESKGNIILITDANAYMEKNSLGNLTKHFANQKIGGVEGKYILKNNFSSDIGTGESFFRRLENWIREKESKIDSVLCMVGEISCFRKDIISHLDENIIAEDFDMSIRIRKNGYKVLHEPSSVIWEYAPNSIQDEITQKKRRVIGTLQIMIKHYKMVFNPKYGLYSFLILPSHSFLRVFSPFFLTVLLITSFYYYFSLPNLWITGLICMELALISAELLYLGIKKFNFRINNIFISIHYFFVSQLIVLYAWQDFMKGNYKIIWDKIDSSR